MDVFFHWFKVNAVQSSVHCLLHYPTKRGWTYLPLSTASCLVSITFLDILHDGTPFFPAVCCLNALCRLHFFFHLTNACSSFLSQLNVLPFFLVNFSLIGKCATHLLMSDLTEWLGSQVEWVWSLSLSLSIFSILGKII